MHQIRVASTIPGPNRTIPSVSLAGRERPAKIFEESNRRSGGIWLEVDVQGTCIARTVAIQIALTGIGEAAVIADIAHQVAVGILLQTICYGGAVVYIATYAIPVFIVVGVVGTRVTGITEAVVVGIILCGIGGSRAVVDIATNPITIDIVVGIQRTGVANIAQSITISVELGGVRD